MEDEKLEVGNTVKLTLYDHQPTLRVRVEGKVLGIPTSDAMRGTVKIEVTRILSREARVRKFNRDLVGKHMRVALASLEEVVKTQRLKN